MLWTKSNRADPKARAVADQHYNRQKPDSPQFVPPGRRLVLYAENCNGRALWVTSWPYAQYIRHAWAGAWMCSAFRNEGAGVASELIREAVAACQSWGLTFDSINESLPDWIEAFGTRPRKVGATEYWDDRAVRLPVSTEPLTLAELRGMDGEPAWCEDFGCWGIVRVDQNGNWKNKPFLMGHLCGAKFEYDIGRRRLKLYRHKP